MTAQRTDTIIIDNNEHKMYALPLEQYWELNNNKPGFMCWNTALQRGYYAKWLIKKQCLYLVDFYGEYDFFKTYKEYSLQDLFPSSEKVFADWFTGDIIIPMGKEVDYFHGGWGATYEYSTTIKILNGIVTDPGLFIAD